jgi:hypothetical protein
MVVAVVVEMKISPHPSRSHERTLKTKPNPCSSDSELGWSDKIETVEKHAFSGLPGTNAVFSIIEDSSPIQMLQATLLTVSHRSHYSRG